MKITANDAHIKLIPECDKDIYNLGSLKCALEIEFVRLADMEDAEIESVKISLPEILRLLLAK